VTVDERTVIDLSDILALQMECKYCPTIVACPIGQMQLRPFTCPNCGEMVLVNNTEEMDLLRAFTKATRQLSGDATEKHSLRVRLQINRTALDSSSASASPVTPTSARQ
jgi:hypothetical protein